MYSKIQLSTQQKIALAKICNRCVRVGRATLMLPMQGEFKRGGINWALDLNEGIDFSIFLLGAFERVLVRTYQRLVRPGDTVIDIGANIGAHTLRLAKQVGTSGRVIAIEATTYASTKLRKNLSLNSNLATQTTIIQALLASQNNAFLETEISSSWPLSGTEKTDAIHGGALRTTIGADVTTLDSLLSNLRVYKINWIKLDVDGHELDVLKGSLQCLKNSRPSIFMELAPHCFDWHDFQDLIEIMAMNHYEFSQIPNYRALPVNAETLCNKFIPKGGSINILARVKD